MDSATGTNVVISTTPVGTESVVTTRAVVAEVARTVQLEFNGSGTTGAAPEINEVTIDYTQMRVP